MRGLLLVLLLGMVLAAPVLGQQTIAGEKNGKNVDSLIRDLKDDNSTIRENAADALVEFNDTRTVEALIQALNDNDSIVRWRSAEALLRINDTRAVEPLILALKDENENVRMEARKALTKLGWKQGDAQIQTSGMANGSMQSGCHTDPVTGRITCVDLSHSTSTQGTQNSAQQGNAVQLSGNWKMTGHQTGFNDWGANLTLNFDGTLGWMETKGSNVGANRTGTWQFDGTTFTMTWVAPGGGKANWISKSVHENYLEDGTYTVENAPGGSWSAFRADNRSLKTAIPAKGEIEDSNKPTIGNLRPPEGSSTTDNLPMISADLADEGSGVNVSSVRISVDGTGVTEKAMVKPTRIRYTPKEALPSGNHHAKVIMEDNAGNLEERSWSFTIYSEINQSVINTSQADLSKAVRSYPKSSESLPANESNPSLVLNTTPQRIGPTMIIPNPSVPKVNNTSPATLNISSPATVNIYINTTMQPNGPTMRIINPSVSKVNNTSPASEPYTRLINGHVKYVGGNVVRTGVDVRLQEMFNGKIFDIVSAVSSRQDGSFKIAYSSDRLHNPDNPHLILQAFYGGKPFSDPVENVGGTNERIELICAPHQAS